MAFGINPDLTQEQRRALLWVRTHQPTRMTRWEPGVPRGATRSELLDRGLIEFDPHRKRFDPVTYCLTEAGEKALQG